MALLGEASARLACGALVDAGWHFPASRASPRDALHTPPRRASSTPSLVSRAPVSSLPRVPPLGARGSLDDSLRKPSPVGRGTPASASSGPRTSDAWDSHDDLSCELGVLGVELPALLDAADFRTCLTFGGTAYNDGLRSSTPHTFVAGEDAFRRDLVHIRVLPRSECAGRVQAELETFLSLSVFLDRAGIGQRRSVALGLVPAGSGAAPRDVFAHSARDRVAASAPRVTLSVVIRQNDGAESSAYTSAPNTARTMSPRGLLSARSSATACSSAGAAEAALRRQLQSSRNEIRMQQALIGFQEKRLKELEGAERRAEQSAHRCGELEASARHWEQEAASLREAAASARQWEEEVMALRDRVWNQERSLARSDEDLRARDRRIEELEIALEEREEQLEAIPDAVDRILRGPEAWGGPSDAPAALQRDSGRPLGILDGRGSAPGSAATVSDSAGWHAGPTQRLEPCAAPPCEPIAAGGRDG